jgi:hypothetical protein
MKLFSSIGFILALMILLMRFTESGQTTKEDQQIARVWRGWTTIENVAKLENILRKEAIPGIEANKLKGLKGTILLTLQRENEVEFTTIMYFDSIEAVKHFAGEEYSKAHISQSRHC